MDAVGGAGPDVALGVHAQAVREARRDLHQDPAAGQLTALHDVEGTDVVRPVGIVRTAAVSDVEDGLIGREGQAVGFDEILSHDIDRASLGIGAEDVLPAVLALGLVALVVAVDAVRRVREPDAAVRLHDHVVG